MTAIPEGWYPDPVVRDEKPQSDAIPVGPHNLDQQKSSAHVPSTRTPTNVDAGVS